MILHILLNMSIMALFSILYFKISTWYDNKFRPGFDDDKIWDEFEKAGPYLIIGFSCFTLMFASMAVLNSYLT